MSQEVNAEQTELNRRSFMAAAAAAACACALCPLASAAAKDDEDDDDDDDKVPDVPKGPVDVGALADFKKDGVYDKWIKPNHLIVVRDKGRLFAETAICTHKGVLLKEKEGQLFCPKHSSRFTVQGVPAPKPNGKLGPAKKPLVHFAISTNDKGHVIVDTSKPIEKDKWEDAGGFIKI